MKKTMLVALTSLSLSACSLFGGDEKPWCDPNSPLHPGLTPEQLADCEASDETGGTGDDGGSEALTCEPINDNLNYQFAEFCFVGNYDLDDPNDATPAFVHRAKSECPQLSDEFPCNRTWGALDPFGAHDGLGGGAGDPLPPPAAPWAAGTMCVLCKVESTNTVLTPPAPLAQPPQSSNAGWKLCEPCTNCQSIADPVSFKPAVVDNGIPANTTHWIDDLECMEYTDPGFACPKGITAIDRGYALQEDLIWESYFTCQCSSDADCQPGAVCEAGWHTEGLVPQPTLCTWDDGSGTSNGVAPDGPSAYGLDRWESGITLSPTANTVKATSAFVVAAVNGGLWNDDQRFTIDGEITHCGRDALCSLFELAVGDVVSIDPSDAIDFIEDGLPLTVSVYKSTGSPIVWTVTLVGH